MWTRTLAVEAAVVSDAAAEAAVLSRCFSGLGDTAAFTGFSLLARCAVTRTGLSLRRAGETTTLATAWTLGAS